MVDPLDRLIAHDEIRQLVARYAVAVDSRDIEVDGAMVHQAILQRWETWQQF